MDKCYYLFCHWNLSAIVSKSPSKKERKEKKVTCVMHSESVEHVRLWCTVLSASSLCVELLAKAATGSNHRSPGGCCGSWCA